MKTRIVFVHGSLSSGEEWRPYADLLPDAEVVTIDLPGHGRYAGGSWSNDAAFASITAAVAGSRAGQRTVLAGHSLGGYLSYAWAAAHPDALDGLVLIGTSADPAGPLSAIYRGFAWLIERVNHDKLASVRNRIGRWLGLRGDQLPHAQAYQVLPSSWRAVDDVSPIGLMRRIEVPVLFINGQYDQMRINEKRYLALTPTRKKLVIIPKASHIAPMTHPSLVATEIAAFVESLG